MGQHTVPQRHLRNFQDPDRPDFVWLHDREGGEPRCAAIKNVLQKRGFYSPEMETFLARSVELPGNLVIDKLTRSAVEGRRIVGAERLTEIERAELAVYIGAMIRRVPYNREWSRGLRPETIAKAAGQVRARIGQFAADPGADPALAARMYAELERLEVECRDGSPPEVVVRTIEDPIPGERIVAALHEMTWRVLVSSGPQLFITTDNPAFFFRWEGFGLGNTQSELSIPLSSTHCLHGSRQGPRGGLLYVAADQKIVKEINRRLASQATRLAVYHRPAPWLTGLLAKGDLYLSRIAW